MISFYVHVKASFDLNVTREKGVNLKVILEKTCFMRHKTFATFDHPVNVVVVEL